MPFDEYPKMMYSGETTTVVQDQAEEDAAKANGFGDYPGPVVPKQVAEQAAVPEAPAVPAAPPAPVAEPAPAPAAPQAVDAPVAPQDAQNATSTES